MVDAPALISLAEATRRDKKILTRGASAELETGAAPTFSDLTEALHFSLGDGRIWLNDQRMVLMQSVVLGRLREELIGALGVDTAKAIFMRVGYMQGVRDAELVKRRWPHEDLTHALAAGPRVHTLEGFVKVTTKQFEFDSEKGTYFGEFHWDDSCEAAEHLASYGHSADPACWLQTGYPSGYTTALFGKPVIFRETECIATGSQHCVVIGQHADAWGTDAPEREYFGLDRPGRRNFAPTKAPDDVPAGAPASTEDRSAVIGVSAAFMRTRHLLQKVAVTDATVLFMGESGVGKELFSNQLHALSSRSSGPFMAINCAAIPENLVESTLFGVEKGGFTGATTSRPGYFERADKGTIFLDEVSSLTYAAQGKLLRALQERTIERVGGAKSVHVDVRVVAACNVDLAAEVTAGRFRQDLYFRLCVFPIVIPPLRERRDDIPLLMAHFLEIYSARYGRRLIGFTRRATDALLKYDYPGNIRELQNLIERGVVYADNGGSVDIAHMFSGSELLPPFMVSLSSDGHLAQSPLDLRARNPEDSQHPGQIGELPCFADVEGEAYRAALARSNGSVAGAARLLKITRAQLEYRLKRLAIRP